MLWDMARFQNYDIRSPYNREAAQWSANQTLYRFPLDPRPLRDSRIALGRVEFAPAEASASVKFPAIGESVCILDMELDMSRASKPSRPEPEPVEEVIFLD
jgi:hypothetical protein